MWWGLEQDPTSSKIRRDDDDDDDVIGRDKQNNKRIDNKNENMVYSYISSSLLSFYYNCQVRYCKDCAVRINDKLHFWCSWDYLGK